MTRHYASAASSSALITISLLFVMQLLISIQPSAQTESRQRSFVEFVRQPPPEDPVKPIDHKHKKDDLTRSDPTPPRNQYPSDSEMVSIPRSTPAPPADKPTTMPSFYSDGPLVALVRVEPTYPIKASSQGLEGHVIVEFDVSPDGKVFNAKVIESSHRVFEKAALSAAASFKFKPRIVDGVALETRGIQNLFRFTLED